MEAEGRQKLLSVIPDKNCLRQKQLYSQTRKSFTRDKNKTVAHQVSEQWHHYLFLDIQNNIWEKTVFKRKRDEENLERTICHFHHVIRQTRLITFTHEWQQKPNLENQQISSGRILQLQPLQPTEDQLPQPAQPQVSSVSSKCKAKQMRNLRNLPAI